VVAGPTLRSDDEISSADIQAVEDKWVNTLSDAVYKAEQVKVQPNMAAFVGGAADAATPPREGLIFALADDTAAGDTNEDANHWKAIVANLARERARFGDPTADIGKCNGDGGDPCERMDQPGCGVAVAEGRWGRCYEDEDRQVAASPDHLVRCHSVEGYGEITDKLCAGKASVGGWSNFVDRIVVINLKQRPDRKTYMSTMLSRLVRYASRLRILCHVPRLTLPSCVRAFRHRKWIFSPLWTCLYGGRRRFRRTSDAFSNKIRERCCTPIYMESRITLINGTVVWQNLQTLGVSVTYRSVGCWPVAYPTLRC
jgi:hypothetical protein